MSTIAKASDHVKPCNIAQSERHNRRDTEYIKSLNPARLYIRTNLSQRNETYVAADMKDTSLQQHYDNIKAMVKEKTGRAMQEKDVEYTDKKGKKRVRKGSSPIRESVVNIKPDTTMEDLLSYTEKARERWGIRAIQIHIHKDEGHYEKPKDPSTWVPNLHAHIIWDWMDHTTGKSYKLNDDDMSAMQDMVAETLDMQRGQKKSETGLDHLERNDLILEKQREEKKRLQAEIAKKKQEYNQLAVANRSKTEKLERTEWSIEIKEKEAKILDNDIEKRRDKLENLTSMAKEEVCKIYELRNREDWQDPMFHGMATYIYAVNDELRFCADAVIDFAKSGFGGRGGRHGDILWDNESTAIKHFLTEFARLAQTAIEKVAQWFVWICKQAGQLNDWELRRADSEIKDLVDGRYDGRIRRFENHHGGLSR